MATYYFDGSDAGATDPNAVFTNDANAFDGNTATNATTSTIGSVSSNYLMAEGTNAPASGSPIERVIARVFGTYSGANFAVINAAIYTDGLGTLLGTPSTDGNFGAKYGGYVTLAEPSGGWSWTIIQALEVKIYESASGAASLDVARVELEVFFATTGFNINRLRPRIFGPGIAK